MTRDSPGMGQTRANQSRADLGESSGGIFGHKM